MKRRVPTDLLQVDEQVLGAMDRRQLVSVGASVLIFLESAVHRMAFWLGVAWIAALLLYAFADFAGQPLRRLAPSLIRMVLRQVKSKFRGGAEPSALWHQPTPRSRRQA